VVALNVCRTSSEGAYSIKRSAKIRVYRKKKMKQLRLVGVVNDQDFQKAKFSLEVSGLNSSLL